MQRNNNDHLSAVAESLGTFSSTRRPLAGPIIISIGIITDAATIGVTGAAGRNHREPFTWAPSWAVSESERENWDVARRATKKCKLKFNFSLFVLVLPPAAARRPQTAIAHRAASAQQTHPSGQALADPQVHTASLFAVALF